MTRSVAALALLVAATLSGCSGGGGGGGSDSAPLATDDVATTTEETAVVVDVLANDDDAGENELAIVGFTNGTNGETSLSAAGTLTYLPDAGFTGTDTFTYEISDGGNETGSATVTITVEAIADFEEAPEPNDDTGPGETGAGEFDVPALGAEAVVLGGCIDPYVDADVSGDDDADFDPWLMTASEPAVVEIRVDSDGGLSGGFVVVSADTSLSAMGWTRFGIDFDGDSSSRQVYLPTAGLYALLITDTRTLTIGTAAGSPDACYLASISRVAEPTPITGTIGTPMAIPAGDVPAFVDFVPSASGQTLSVEHTIDGDSTAVLSSVLALRNGVPDEYDGAGSPLVVAGLDSSDTLRLVVEPYYDFTLEPREVTLEVTIVP